MLVRDMYAMHAFCVLLAGCGNSSLLAEQNDDVKGVESNRVLQSTLLASEVLCATCCSPHLRYHKCCHIQQPLSFHLTAGRQWHCYQQLQGTGSASCQDHKLHDV
jgi:hypothetical protein